MTSADRPPRIRPGLERLDDRLTPTVAFQFDYSLDLSGFFTVPAHRDALETAAAQIEGRITATPTAIAPGGANTWQALFTHPSTREPTRLTNLAIPSGTILVFAGGMGAGGSEVGEGGPGGYWVNGSGTFQDTVATRGLSGFGPWGGSIAFDVTADWYLGADPSLIGPDQVDFQSVAVHELGHLLGAGTSDAWNAHISGRDFVGASAVAAYGGPVPLAADESHFAQGTRINGQPVALQPILAPGRVDFSELDFAALDDIGWQIADGTISQPGTPPGSLRSPIAAGELTAVSGPIDGTVQLFSTGSDGRLVAVGNPFRPFLNFGGPVRTATADVNADGIADLIVGTGPGGGSQVRILDGTSLEDVVEPFAVFEPGFLGGIFLSAGDLNGDGRDELVVTPDQGGGPRVRIYSIGSTATVVADFFGIDDPNFRGGARTAVGDLDGDRRPDLVVAAGFGGGPRVAFFDGTTLRQPAPRRLIADFFAFEPGLRNGVYVTAGDVNGDGRADPTFGAGPGGGPRVLTLDARTLLGTGLDSALTEPLVNDFAGDSNLRGGVRVVARDLTGDSRTELITGSGDGGDLLAFRSNSVGLSQFSALIPFGDTLPDGIYVG